MDPLTQTLALLNKVFDFGTKVWDAMPKELQTKNASDWGEFTHNVGGSIIALQNKINGLVTK